MGRAQVRLGKTELFLLSDGVWALDGGAAFGIVPKVLWQQVASCDDKNRVPMALNCLLIISEGKRILVDTGYGTKLSLKEEQQFALKRSGSGLLDAIQAIGLAPDDVDIVINTHLHSDHCGGNTVLQSGVPVPAFPRAEYWVQRQEWADARYPNERASSAYQPANFAVLEQSRCLRLLCGDERVTSEVRCMVTRGHTRAHQSVVIESEGETAIFLGDVASRAVLLERLKWSSAFDVEPFEMVESKRALRAWACERHALLLFGHGIDLPMGRLRQDGDRFLVEGAA